MTLLHHGTMIQHADTQQVGTIPYYTISYHWVIRNDDTIRGNATSVYPLLKSVTISFLIKRLLELSRWTNLSLIFTRNGVKSLGVIRRHSVFSMKQSGNCIITPLRHSSAYVCGSIRQQWLGLVFVEFEA